jgi:hypothetical protein
MPFVSVTRLRLRAIRFLPGFAFHTLRSMRQVRRAEGFLAGSVLRDRHRTFWTLTVWDGAAPMRAYRDSDAHRTAMPRLQHWCDEASVVHWDQPGPDVPSWAEAERRMRASGRPSRVRHPSTRHAALAYAPPRLGTAQAIDPRPGRPER